jgi:type IV pilus assembly protein PilB
MEHLQESANQASVVQLVNHILCDAVQQEASDIHVEPDEGALRIRYRIDGVLCEKRRPPHQMHAAIISRIKIMARLDIAEQQCPQEGLMKVMVEDRPVDMRVYIMPGCRGERVLIRIVDSKKPLLNLESLGFTIDNLRQLREVIPSPRGLFLITGPGGSGKRTTLYALVSQCIGEEVNICTIEDPLEISLEGVSQFEVNTWAKGDTSTVFHHILQQDPDIVMLRALDNEKTASLAAQAALKKTLILSSLHTDDIAAAVHRLYDLQVPPYWVGDVLIGGLSQRLVRKICSGCKTKYDPSSEIHQTVKHLGRDIPQYYKGKGCDQCRGTGFSGHIAIHELFIINAEIRDMIGAQAQPLLLREAAIKHGMVPLVHDGLEKVKAGIVPIEEILRVVPVHQLR